MTTMTRPKKQDSTTPRIIGISIGISIGPSWSTLLFCATIVALVSQNSNHAFHHPPVMAAVQRRTPAAGLSTVQRRTQERHQPHQQKSRRRGNAAAGAAAQKNGNNDDAWIGIGSAAAAGDDSDHDAVPPDEPPSAPIFMPPIGAAATEPPGTAVLSGAAPPDALQQGRSSTGIPQFRRFRVRRSLTRPTTTTGNGDGGVHSGGVGVNWTKENLAIAVPALVGLLADPLLSLVDTAFVGRVGAVDLAALGVCTSIFHMAFTLFRASTVATTSLVGSASSAEERRQITKISLSLGGVMGTLVLLALRLGGPAILAAMGVPPSSPLHGSACSYLFTRCWAAPAVVGIVVAEGAFRGSGDNRTPLIAACVAAGVNLVLDPLLMFPLGMGMAGAALATAVSQGAAAALYGWRLRKRRLLPQKARDDTAAAATTTVVDVSAVVRAILGANAAMLAKNFSMLVFYTAATVAATRMGPTHVAAHQVCLSLFWLTTMWLDSASISAQLLMARHRNDPAKAVALIRYMTRYALAQGLAFSAALAVVARYIPGVFTSDPAIAGYVTRCLPHVALQQTVVSVCLAWEGLAVGGNQFRYTAAATAACTVVGLWRLSQAASVVDIWASTVNTFFCARLVSAAVGVIRVRGGLDRVPSPPPAAVAAEGTS